MLVQVINRKNKSKYQLHHLSRGSLSRLFQSCRPNSNDSSRRKKSGAFWHNSYKRLRKKPSKLRYYIVERRYRNFMNPRSPTARSIPEPPRSRLARLQSPQVSTDLSDPSPAITLTTYSAQSNAVMSPKLHEIPITITAVAVAGYN